MPNYAFKCENCEKKWECFLTVSERDTPLKEKCPHCNKKKIAKDWMENSLSIGVDATLTPNKATGGRWNELMSKMKAGMPKRYGRKLDSPNNMSGRRWNQ